MIVSKNNGKIGEHSSPWIKLFKKIRHAFFTKKLYFTFSNFSRDDTWMKLRLSLAYLYYNFLDYDWFVRSCDNTYLIVDNLRLFLQDKDPDQPHFYGEIAWVCTINWILNNFIIESFSFFSAKCTYRWLSILIEIYFHL